jgi:uncharacterized protein YjbI with pentapeptide repeats
VVSTDTGELVLLVDALRSVVEWTSSGFVEIVGGRGSGKTTALWCLRNECRDSTGFTFLDEPVSSDIRSQPGDKLVVFTRMPGSGIRADYRFCLAEWTDDELIEYLLLAHPQQCKSVMSRVRADTFMPTLGGRPETVRLVLDDMAQDPEASPREALLRIINLRLPDDDTKNAAEIYVMAELMGNVDVAAKKRQRLAHLDADPVRLLRHRSVQLLLATERIRRMLTSDGDLILPRSPLPGDLLAEIGKSLANSEPTHQRLRHALASPHIRFHAAAASILHALGQRWTPPGDRSEDLPYAILPGVDWSNADLRNAALDCAVLRQANLSHARLDKASLIGGHFNQACLRHASLQGTRASGADFSECDLEAVHAHDCSFEQANLTSARLDQAMLMNSVFRGANLTRASFRSTNLFHADLTGATIAETDFSRANLRGAILSHLPLRVAILDGACFADCMLKAADLEAIILPDANFGGANLSRAHLSGSVMHRAKFHGAILIHAGLADIDWEDADLRHADLTGCDFFLGSTRSGIVDSPYPSHGTRTGFYTDDYESQYFQGPEEIRKANLRGADLRGAKIAATDFYLVDLRGARYDSDQEDHLRKCRAILS